MSVLDGLPVESDDRRETYARYAHAIAGAARAPQSPRVPMRRPQRPGLSPLGIPGRVALRGLPKPQVLMLQDSETQTYAQK